MPQMPQNPEVVIYFIVTFLGMMESLWVAQLWSNARLGKEDCFLAAALRRFSLVCISISYGGSLWFALDKGWEPWPTYLYLTLCLDAYFGVTIYSAYFGTSADRHVRNFAKYFGILF